MDENIWKVFENENFPEPRSRHAAVELKKNMYIFGGEG